LKTSFSYVGSKSVIALKVLLWIWAIKSSINNACFLYNFFESKVIAKASWHRDKKRLITLKVAKR